MTGPTWSDTLAQIEAMKNQRPRRFEFLMSCWQIEMMYPEVRREMVRRIHRALGDHARSNGCRPGPLKTIRSDELVVFRRGAL